MAAADSLIGIIPRTILSMEIMPARGCSKYPTQLGGLASKLAELAHQLATGNITSNRG